MFRIFMVMVWTVGGAVAGIVLGIFIAQYAIPDRAMPEDVTYMVKMQQMNQALEDAQARMPYFLATTVACTLLGALTRIFFIKDRSSATQMSNSALVSGVAVPAPASRIPPQLAPQAAK